MAAITYPPIPIFEIGPLNLSLHGLFAGVGFAAGAALMIRQVRARGFDVDAYWSVLGWSLVGALVGARLFTIPAHLGDLGFDFGAAISLSGSYSILAGFAGGILTAWWRIRRLGLDPWVSLDMAAPGLALGTVIGRLGDLAIVEHLGKGTDFFLGYAIKPGYDVAPQHDVLECSLEQAVDGICGVYHHTALYDFLAAAILLGVLWWAGKRWRGLHYGQLFGFWMTWYGAQRFFVDFARIGAANADRMGGPLTWSQWAALAAAIAGFVLYSRLRSQPVVTLEADHQLGARTPPSGRGA